jgi:hypothetical protein
VQPLDPIEDEVQAAVRSARILATRGDKDGMEKVIRELLSKHPDHPSALEAEADLLVAQGKLNEAREKLHELVKAHPERKATEEKYAKLVLRIEEQNISASLLLGEGDLRTLMNPAGVRRSAGTASMLSILAPGFGQIYNGELVKGIILLGGIVLLWVCLFAFGFIQGSGRLTGAGWVLVVVVIAYYFGCILDAAVTAPKAAGPAAPERPKPPVDKPFE